MIIDITDRKTNELVWRGTVTDRINSASVSKQLKKGVRAILRKYPAAPGNKLELPKEEAVS